MLRRTCALLSIAFALSILTSTVAMATAQRTFVASNGNDSNSCSLVLPCRSFAAAIAQTTSGGEVIVLDSAGYGPVTIGQSVSIIAPLGVYAGISVFSGFDGVNVMTGPTDKVVLRGLTINGQGGNIGIHVSSGGETYIQDCTLDSLALNGIFVEGGTEVHVTRSVVRSSIGSNVLVEPSAAKTVNMTIEDSILSYAGGLGFDAITTVAGSAIHAVIDRVTASRNGGSGFAADSNNLGVVTMSVIDSTAAANGLRGVFVGDSNATAIVSGSSLVGNGLADLAQASSSVLRTAGNNTVTGRGAADISGTLTSNPLK